MTEVTSPLHFLQVILTDQAHILPLATVNLHLNFPATDTNSRHQQDRATGTFGKRAHTAEDATTATATTAAHVCGQPFNSTADTAGGPQGFSATHQSDARQQQDHEQSDTANTPLTVAEAVLATFCPKASHEDDQMQQYRQEQQQRALLQQFSWKVFGPGPLVVHYQWGETQQQLQQRSTTAAAARLFEAAAPDKTAVAAEGHVQPAGLLPQVMGSAYDVVVGADLLYDPGCHHLLLDSLQEVCSAHTQVRGTW